MSGLGVKRMDKEGRTPRQMFEARPNAGEAAESLALRFAFERLMASISEEPSFVTNEEEEDEFFDAVSCDTEDP
jgi:hypothetical protein